MIKKNKLSINRRPVVILLKRLSDLYSEDDIKHRRLIVLYLDGIKVHIISNNDEDNNEILIVKQIKRTMSFYVSLLKYNKYKDMHLIDILNDDTIRWTRMFCMD